MMYKFMIYCFIPSQTHTILHIVLVIFFNLYIVDFTLLSIPEMILLLMR